MASALLSVSSIAQCHRISPLGPKKYPSKRAGEHRLHAKNSNNSPSTDTGKAVSGSENAVLRVAWYGSEILGIVASLFRPPPPKLAEANEEGLGLKITSRDQVVQSIKLDFDRSYFVTGTMLVIEHARTSIFGNSIGEQAYFLGLGNLGIYGNLTFDAYEVDCEFADPAGSFRGLDRFKRNCTNFGSLLVKSNMKLTKWEDLQDKGIGHWRFSCVMSFPWRPILSATGYTEYYFDAQSGKVCRHVENWNVPKMALLKQIFRPTRWEWGRST